jgi:hypothetical protein
VSKIDANFLSLAQMVLLPVVGGGGFGLAMFFLWLMMNDQLFAGCLCSAGFVTLCGYGFSLFWVGDFRHQRRV